MSEAAKPEGADQLGPVLEFMKQLWAVDHGLQSVSKRMEARFGITGPQRLVVRIVGRFPGISAGALKDGRDGLKILGDGELTKVITVRAHKVSAQAREKIEKAGGKIELIEPAPRKTPQQRKAEEKAAAAAAKGARATARRPSTGSSLAPGARTSRTCPASPPSGRGSRPSSPSRGWRACPRGCAPGRRG